MTKNAGHEVLRTIDTILAELGQTKKAEANTEPSASVTNNTEHPVKNTDDQTQPNTEGAQTANNAADVKEQGGETAVDNQPDASSPKSASVFRQLADRARTAKKAAEGAAADQLQLGTNKQSTGDDPANELASVKDKPKDEKLGNTGGTTSPISVSEIKADKYAFDKMSFDQLASALGHEGNELCASFIKLAEAAEAAAPPAKAGVQPAAAKVAADAERAKNAGFELAGLAIEDARAVDAMVRHDVGQIIKTASDRADRYIAFARAKLSKRAGMPPDAGGGMPPGGGAPPGDPSADAASAMMGLPEGGPPPGPPGAGGPGGEGGHDDKIQQAMAALQALGVSPEELLAAISGGGDAGGAGASPPPDAGPPAGGHEQPASDKTPAMKRASAQEIRAYVRELGSRSRAA